MHAKNFIFGITATCSCENSRHAESIIDGSVITCDEITETKGVLAKTVPTKSIPTNFNKKGNP